MTALTVLQAPLLAGHWSRPGPTPRARASPSSEGTRQLAGGRKCREPCPLRTPLAPQAWQEEGQLSQIPAKGQPPLRVQQARCGDGCAACICPPHMCNTGHDPHHITLHHITLRYFTILYYTILYYTILYYTILYYTILYYTILYYTVLYCTVLYCTLLYSTMLDHTILHHTILLYCSHSSLEICKPPVRASPPQPSISCRSGVLSMWPENFPKPIWRPR